MLSIATHVSCRWIPQLLPTCATQAHAHSRRLASARFARPYYSLTLHTLISLSLFYNLFFWVLFPIQRRALGGTTQARARTSLG